VESFEITLQFPDIESCAEFYKNASEAKLEHDDFDIALPDLNLNFDNNVISLVVTFVQHGGLQTVTAVATLLKVLFDKLSPHDSHPKGRFVHIATKRGKIDINTNMTAAQIRDLLNANIFRKQ
jgi:hypothetical protein